MAAITSWKDDRGGEKPKHRFSITREAELTRQKAPVRLRTQQGQPAVQRSSTCPTGTHHSPHLLSAAASLAQPASYFCFLALPLTLRLQANSTQPLRQLHVSLLWSAATQTSQRCLPSVWGMNHHRWLCPAPQHSVFLHHFWVGVALLAPKRVHHERWWGLHQQVSFKTKKRKDIYEVL